MNIRGEGNDSYSSHISLEKVHVFENGGDAISFSKAAYVSLFDSSVGKNRRHGITLSSSKHALLRDISIKGNEGAKTCGIALRDSTHDVLVEKVSIENATQAGICARDTIGVMVKFSTIENLQSNQASCYHVRTTTGFDEQGNTCRVVSDQEFNTDESITTGLQPSTPSRKPSTTDSPAPAYVIITMGGV